jgi:excisionase family DNA binding protein
MNANASLPFAERVACTVNEACQASGLGRTTIYAKIADGTLKSTKVGERRLVFVASLLEMLRIGPSTAHDACTANHIGNSATLYRRP